MKIESLIKVLHAAHWSYLVEGKWVERGGLMLVARPGQLKSSIIKTLSAHDRALIMSDINVPTVSRLRQDIADGRYRTLAFTEFEKIYQRDPATSQNIEAHLRAFVDEGFRAASFEDSRMIRRQAYCMVIGAMTTNCYQRHFSLWDDSGFGRRFLWVHYSLRDPSIITKHITNWSRISFRGLAIIELKENQLPYNLTKPEAQHLLKFLPLDSNTSYTLLQKIAVVLKHAEGKHYMGIIEDFAESLMGEGAWLDIPNGKPHHTKTAGRKVRRSGVRRNSGNASQAGAKKVRVPRLEVERQLPTLPAGSVRND